MKLPLHCLFSLVAMIGTAKAVTTFTETFDSGANGWLTGASGSPTFSATGGVGNSGYISFTAATIAAGPGSFGSPFTQLMFRANDAANASGDAFVGNWIADGVETMTISLIHDNATSLDFYLRIAGAVPGGAASLATSYTVAPNIWTTISIPITNSNPPFSSFGASNFGGVFGGVLNMQLGLYLPEGNYTNLTMGIDNVGITAVPEPSSVALLGLGALGLLRRKRNR